MSIPVGRLLARTLPSTLTIELPAGSVWQKKMKFGQMKEKKFGLM